MSAAAATPRSDESYRTCRRAAAPPRPDVLRGDLLPAARVRPAVHALYGFVRGADQIVDGPRATAARGRRARRWTRWERRARAGLRRGRSEHPVIAALVDAGARHDLPLHLLGATWTRCASTATAGAAAHARRARRLHGGQRRRRSGGSWRRCSARPEGTRRSRAWASPSSSRTSSATCPWTGRWTASTCPACPSDDLRRRSAPATAPARARSRRRSRGRAALFAETAEVAAALRPRDAPRHAGRARRSTAACSTASSATASTCSAPARLRWELARRRRRRWRP